MHIVVIAADILPEDNVCRLLRSEEYVLSYLSPSSDDLDTQLHELKPDIVLYRDMGEHTDPATFLKQLCGFSLTLLNQCPFLFTFREPETYSRELYGLCNGSALPEPPDPLTLLAKITTMVKLFDTSDNLGIVANTRHFMEMQFCSTVSHTENLVKALRPRLERDPQAQAYLDDILKGLDDTFHIAGALCYDDRALAPQHVNHCQEDKSTLAALCRHAVEEADNRSISRVRLNDAFLELIHVDFNHISLGAMIADALDEMLTYTQGAYISGRVDNDILLDIHPRATQGAPLFTLTDRGLRRIRNAAQSHDGDACILLHGDGAILRISIPQKAGLRYMPSEHEAADTAPDRQRALGA